MHICSIYKIRGRVIFLHLNFLHSRHSAHYVMTVSKSHVVTNLTLILFITAREISHKDNDQNNHRPLGRMGRQDYCIPFCIAIFKIQRTDNNEAD